MKVDREGGQERRQRERERRREEGSRSERLTAEEERVHTDASRHFLTMGSLRRDINQILQKCKCKAEKKDKKETKSVQTWLWPVAEPLYLSKKGFFQSFLSCLNSYLSLITHKYTLNETHADI